MKIGFIGAGKVGFSLGKFFAEGGIPVIGYYSRHQESAREAALFTGSEPFAAMEDLVKHCDALFLTVPDGSITSVYNELKNFEIAGKLICHCSGAMSSEEAFPEIDAAGAYGYSIHPLFPVSSKYETYRELPGAFFCIEGNEKYLDDVMRLISGLGPKVQIISADAKVRYHAACAISSNLMCALVEESLNLLTTCGFTRESAMEALSPLMRSNLEHLIEKGPVSALTGPVERLDLTTVSKHLKCFPTDFEKDFYRIISRKLVGIAEKKHPETDYHELEDLLKE